MGGGLLGRSTCIGLIELHINIFRPTTKEPCMVVEFEKASIFLGLKVCTTDSLIPT